jgi:uncharacterized protein YbjT (DUF2867 family)
MSDFVLVAGATGRQGGATARALLAAGIPVHALVRDPATDRARAVEALGAELHRGDLLDPESIVRAADGARAVFSVQMPDIRDGVADFEGELTQVTNLVDAARAAGVPQFVHTSVSGAGRHKEIPGDPYAFMDQVFAPKIGGENRVREGGFERWTLIKPAFFMDNFLPSMRFLFPRGVEGGLVSLLKPQTPMSLVATRDIGATAAAAIADPDRFHEVELELASDYLTMAEIAEVLSRVLGVPLTAPDMTLEEALAAGLTPAGTTHDFMNQVGQPARPEFARALGIPLTGFEEWARATL